MREYRFYYSVRGTTRFPIDMLRRDNAWPLTERDADLIQRMCDREDRRKMRQHAEIPVTINLVSTDAPIADRWRSFRWTVVTAEYERV